jgi:hypothetical protein
MKTKVISFAFTILLLAAGGCSTHKDLTTQRVKYRTFSIAPLPSTSPPSDPTASERLNPIVKAAIEEGLTSKGYQEESQSPGDLIVKVHTEYYSDGTSPEIDQRALCISMFDWRSNMDVWRTSRSRTSRDSLDPELLRKGVLEMLSSIPTIPAHSQ